MTVYVDDMYKYPMGQFGRMKMSHMVADAEGELHAMAKAIGVARKWYQGDHYDICMSYRVKAIELGAVEISMRQLAAICYLQKIDPGCKVDPEYAIDQMLLTKEGIRRHAASEKTLANAISLAEKNLT
jgi:hypothetical protein